jgi:uncharacterized protein YndB with AHSA1/START domain
VGHVEREVVLDAAPEEVWEALTDEHLLSDWFGADVEIAPEGGALFRWRDGRSRRAVMDVSNKPDLLIVRWLPFEHDATGRTHPTPPAKVVFRLDRHPDGTRLRIVETAAFDPVLRAQSRMAAAR